VLDISGPAFSAPRRKGEGPVERGALSTIPFRRVWIPAFAGMTFLL
jgi:hypothetical protein